MIKFSRFELNNGLRVLVHEDETTPLVAVNVLYDVGARDEDENRTGFAHLFEHLMFGGSVNIPDYDKPLQQVGAQNNAFTSNDITNYYITIPHNNLETAFWLESDRMLSLDFNERSLEVQRNVVIEEFRQRYLNQPYGDAWLLLRPLSYKTHPYKWATIGKEINHIEQATLKDVKAFFKKHYSPTNAILSVAGHITEAQVHELADKWFGSIPAGKKRKRNLPQEPTQTEYRTMEVERHVPANCIYMAFHMCGRKDNDYPATDLMSDVLSRGRSSRLHQKLVKQQQLFSEITAYVTGDTDPGLVIITGKLKQGVSFDHAEEGVWSVLNEIKESEVSNEELEKVKNKVESTIAFAELSIEERALDLAVYELLGDANLVNTEFEKYRSVTLANIKHLATQVLRRENASVLKIKAKQ